MSTTISLFFLSQKSVQLQQLLNLNANKSTAPTINHVNRANLIQQGTTIRN